MIESQITKAKTSAKLGADEYLNGYKLVPAIRSPLVGRQRRGVRMSVSDDQDRHPVSFTWVTFL